MTVPAIPDFQEAQALTSPEHRSNPAGKGYGIVTESSVKKQRPLHGGVAVFPQLRSRSTNDHELLIRRFPLGVLQLARQRIGIVCRHRKMDDVHAGHNDLAGRSI